MSDEFFIVTLDIRCNGCGKTPEEIGEYVTAAQYHGLTPTEYVQKEEGTYNFHNGHFLCTKCYIEAGQPSSPFGWTAE